MKNILKKNIPFTVMLIGFMSFSQSNIIDFTLSNENYVIAYQNINLQSIIKKSDNTLIGIQFDNNGIYDTSTNHIAQAIKTWNTENSLVTLSCQTIIENFSNEYGHSKSLFPKLAIRIPVNKHRAYIFNTNNNIYSINPLLC